MTSTKLIKELTIRRTLNGSRDLAWELWTNPKHVAKWWGPLGFSNPVCEWNAKPGNKIFIEMVAANGDHHPMDGEFMEVRKPERLVFLTAKLGEKGERLVENIHTLTFEEHDGKTIISLHIHVRMATAEAKNSIKGMDIGWNQSLDRFEKCMQTLSN